MPSSSSFGHSVSASLVIKWLSPWVKRQKEQQISRSCTWCLLPYLSCSPDAGHASPHRQVFHVVVMLDERGAFVIFPNILIMKCSIMQKSQENFTVKTHSLFHTFLDCSLPIIDPSFHLPYRHVRVSSLGKLSLPLSLGQGPQYQSTTSSSTPLCHPETSSCLKIGSSFKKLGHT